MTQWGLAGFANFLPPTPAPLAVDIGQGPPFSDLSFFLCEIGATVPPTKGHWEVGAGHSGGAEVHLCCRTAQKHCCVSYLKEKSCMAGVMGAKEGEACGVEDSDTCGISLYKASLTCGLCCLGLRVLEG